MRHYLLLVRAQLSSQAQYRASIALDLVAQLVLLALEVVTALVVLSITPALGGFVRDDALLITGLAVVATTLADLTISGIVRLPNHVDTGRFDVLLVRPLSAFWQVVAIGFQLRRLGPFVGAVALLAVAAASAVDRWSLPHVLLVIVTPLAGATILGSLNVIGLTVTFRWAQSTELVNAVAYGGRDLGMYPQTVFDGVGYRVGANLLGFAFVAYYPGLVLLDRTDPLGAPHWLGWTAPLVALGLARLATAVWRRGLRTYRSTGS